MQSRFVCYQGLERTPVMDMEIARLTNISWLRPTDPQVVAIRAVWQRPDRSWLESGMLAARDARAVPALDWPATLFQDAALCN
jgi:hypothetical protein